MMNLSNIESVLRNIDPQSVARFLSRQGYNRDGGRPGQVEVFSSEGGDMILVPLNQHADDYARRLRDIVELFTDDTTPLDDVVGKIVLPQSDIMRYRIETPETTWGHLRLHYTQEAMGALYNILQYTAAGVSSQRTDYRRVSEAAHSFAQQCRFGQTEYGSFVLKVFCPVEPIVARDDVGEPFGRQTTRAVIENLEFLASERSEDPEEPLPPTLNRQVATSVHRLRPQGNLGVQTEVLMRYIALEPDEVTLAHRATPAKKDDVTKLDLGPFIFSRAKSVRDRLKKAEEFEPELLRGHIETLHKDRPVRDTDQSHEVTLDVRYGTSRRKLRVRLLPRQYRDAIRWHDSNTEVDVDAVIDKRGKVWSVYRLNDFRASDPNANRATLFDVPAPDEDDG
ncbi:MAG: hypothetical protein RBS39_13790 [Phycisphaerales bacterium]|jgi:hypothetical protein|nr:hypothetical protein [Phycisphaerales bacterium]